MKQVKKKDEDDVMKSVILTRYGHLNVLSKNEVSLCSLSIVSKVLNISYDEVRRLYRRFFRVIRPSRKLSHIHTKYLIDRAKM